MMRRLARVRSTEDSGITLVEVMVAMTIMTIFMSMFTVGMLQTFQSVNKTEAMSTAQSQLNIAFLRLDREIRYAERISTPAADAATPRYWFVEYLTVHTNSSMCSALVMDLVGRKLWYRTWRVGLAAGPWRVIASDVGVISAGDAPFRLADTTTEAMSNYQRLRLRLRASAGAAATASYRDIDITFTALNTLRSTSTTTCSAARSTP